MSDYLKPGRVTGVEPFAHSDLPDRQEYDDNLKPSRPAFKDEKEVHRACENYYMQNRQRNERDAWIVDLFFYKPPYSDKKLTDSGYAWTANVPSGFLAAAVASVMPAFLRSANGTKYLTTAKLKNDSKKSEVFQNKITKFIRSWSGWQNLLNCVIQENTLLGRATVRFCDAYDWRPKFYSTGNALFPEQCSQIIEEISQVCFIDQWLPHDFIDKIKNVKVAKGNGWDIDNCVKVLNAAMPVDSNMGLADARKLVNWLADGAYANCFNAEGPLYVETYTMLAVEPDEGGKVSEWVVGRRNGELLYSKKNKYNSMSEAACVFAFSQGQNTLHSSRGFGRLLSNVHQTYDRNLCKLLDDTYLQGMRIVHQTEKRKTDWGIQVKAPFVICPVGITSEPMNTSINVDAFYALVKQLTGLARQIAGAYSPAQILPDVSVERTATEATIDAAKEGELREGILGRFTAHLGKLVWAMTKRALDPKTYDEDAKKLQKELIEDEGFTREELDELVEQMPLDHINNYSSAVRNQKIQQFATLAKGDPNYDQKKLAYLLAETMVDPDFAKEVVLVTPDPTMDQQAIHDQQVESGLILNMGSNIIPGPLDNDLIHLQQAEQDTTAFIQGVNIPNKQQLVGLQNMVKHIDAHIQQAQAKGAKPGDTKQFEQFLQEVVKQIQLYVTNLAKIGSTVASQLSGGQQSNPPQLPQGQPAPDQLGPEGSSVGGQAPGSPGGVAGVL